MLILESFMCYFVHNFFLQSALFCANMHTVKKEFFGAGCDSLLAVKSATRNVWEHISADPVKLRDQQYSLDGRRNGLRERCTFLMFSCAVSLRNSYFASCALERNFEGFFSEEFKEKR